MRRHLRRTRFGVTVVRTHTRSASAHLRIGGMNLIELRYRQQLSPRVSADATLSPRGLTIGGEGRLAKNVLGKRLAARAEYNPLDNSSKIGLVRGRTPYMIGTGTAFNAAMSLNEVLKKKRG